MNPQARSFQIGLLSALLFAAAVGWAQPPKKKKARPKPQPLAVQPAEPPAVETAKPEAAHARRFYVSALYSTAHQVTYKGKVTYNGLSLDGSAKENTTGAFGVGGGYVYRAAGSPGFSAGADFEFARTSSGLTGSAGNLNVTGHYEGDASKALLTAVVNANYSISNEFYFFAGPNYPFVMGGGSGQSYKALFGYQAGAGFAFSDALSAELSYRQVRLHGSVTAPPFSFQIQEATFPGFILRLQYGF